MPDSLLQTPHRLGVRDSRVAFKYERMTKTPPRFLPLLLTCALSSAPAQTLARPGWAGSGMSADPWWKHAVVYHVNPADVSPSEGGPLHGLTQRLDYLHSLGIDALLLTPIQPDTAHAQAIDPALGTVDDLDDLIHQASRRNIRVLLDLIPGIPDLTTVARFWLNRGVAGLHLAGSANAALQLAELRKASASYLGQRVILGDLDPSTPSSQKGTLTHNLDGAQLLLDPRAGTVPQLSASAIRPGIDAAQSLIQAGHSMPLLITDGPTYTRSVRRYADGQHDLAIAKVVATVLLTTGAASQVYSGQELGVTAESPASTSSRAAPNSNQSLIQWDAPYSPAKGPATTASPSDATPSVALEDADPTSLLNWYRSLSGLHHGNPTINSGATITLNHDDQNVLAWIRKPQTVSPISPVLIVICNLSAQPVELSLKPDIERLHLRGTFLRTVLRSDTGRGPMHLEAMTLPPYTVYIGELRY
jgi:Alpha amylase, catalytic domain